MFVHSCWCISFICLVECIGFEFKFGLNSIRFDLFRNRKEKEKTENPNQPKTHTNPAQNPASSPTRPPHPFLGRPRTPFPAARPTPARPSTHSPGPASRPPTRAPSAQPVSPACPALAPAQLGPWPAPSARAEIGRASCRERV